MAISQIIPTKIERAGIQTIGRLIVKLGLVSPNAYEQLNMLYLLEEKKWTTAKKILGDLLSEEEIMLLDICYREYMFVEYARKKGVISKQQANDYMQKRFNATRNKQIIGSLFVQQGMNDKTFAGIENDLIKHNLLEKNAALVHSNITASKSKIAKLKTIKRFKMGDTIFSRYQVLEEIGQGGMGRVYRVKDVEKNRTLALKILTNLQDQQNNYKRFMREAKLMLKLRHPNIVSVYDIEEHNGLILYTMDLVNGTNLSELIEKRSITMQQSVDVVQKIAEAAAYAHQHGIIHRDIKPSNIMIDNEGKPLLMDFGLAKVVEANEKISQTGAILGTPVYMSPEQAAGRLHLINEQSDIYSIGALFYEILTGEMPFKGSSSLAVILQVLNVDPIPPRKLSPQIPQVLENICIKAMNKKQEQRYISGYALAQDLNNYKYGKPTLAKAPTMMASIKKTIMTHRMISFPVISILLLCITFFVYASYKEYRLLFDLQECTGLILDIQQITPKDTEERNKVANSYIATFTDHIHRNSSNSAAYLGRAVCHIIQGHYKEALKDLDKTIDLADKSPFPLEMLYLIRAQCFIDYGKYDPAIGDLKRISQKDKWVWVGIIYKDLGDYTTALRIFDNILNRQNYYAKESTLFANIHKAKILTLQKKVRSAQAYAETAVNMIPYLGGSNLISFYAASAYNTLAEIHIAKGEFEQALSKIKEASKWYPSDESIYRTLAMLERKRGNLLQASSIYKELTKYQGQIHFTYYYYAAYLSEQQQQEKALSYLEKALQHGFYDFTQLQLDNSWNSLRNSEKFQSLVNEYQQKIPVLDFTIK
ncbi:serine/threonine-protein kinase [Candidatus Uabimicrobium amorphum]|uniref:non-specific serine/threonine protein kinase n=1 Tax=Uabimicrobium amorphum TaxID=2596890 RepID=A0A5S9ILY7_UABAM|nr:serine/threonine-protein kinase [Candidatus Uabimicrobium amorphum]BBM83782.1 protein kinase [Candidatus Uabimicrobium amorphum]